MSDTFAVGEVAILQNLHGTDRFGRDKGRLNGTEVTILGPLRKALGLCVSTGRAIIIRGYEVAMPDAYHRHESNVFCPKFLRKKQPPREEVGRWEDVPFFNPTEVTA